MRGMKSIPATLRRPASSMTRQGDGAGGTEQGYLQLFLLENQRRRLTRELATLDKRRKEIDASLAFVDARMNELQDDPAGISARPARPARPVRPAIPAAKAKPVRFFKLGY